jgi:hypothetical protein
MTEAESGLRAVSDELLSELDQLAGIEAEKRTLHPGDERAVELSVTARKLAERILSTSRAEEDLAEGGLQAVKEGLPGAPDRPIEETHRQLHLILDDWREAERGVAAAAPGTSEWIEQRGRADAFRNEYQRAFDEINRLKGVRTD